MVPSGKAHHPTSKLLNLPTSTAQWKTPYSSRRIQPTSPVDLAFRRINKNADPEKYTARAYAVMIRGSSVASPLLIPDPAPVWEALRLVDSRKEH